MDYQFSLRLFSLSPTECPSFYANRFPFCDERLLSGFSGCLPLSLFTVITICSSFFSFHMWAISVQREQLASTSYSNCWEWQITYGFFLSAITLILDHKHNDNFLLVLQDYLIASFWCDNIFVIWYDNWLCDIYLWCICEIYICDVIIVFCDIYLWYICEIYTCDVIIVFVIYMYIYLWYICDVTSCLCVLVFLKLSQ